MQLDFVIFLHSDRSQISIEVGIAECAVLGFSRILHSRFSPILQLSPYLLMAARSSLEQMLDSIRERDDLPKDAPPTLPNRPVKRGRLPTARRFKSAADLSDQMAAPTHQGGNDELQFKSRRRLLTLPEEPVESPYTSESIVSERRNFRNSRNSIVSPVPSSSSSSSIHQFGYSLKENLCVWCRLPNANWERGTVQSFDKEDAHISLSDGRVLKLSTENILPANPDLLNALDDLSQLSYLNEPSVLHNLSCRYSSDKVYTKAGPVLIAVNPFKEVPIYVNDKPHVYVVAGDAYEKMMRDEISQSIIISGESGAGKTETAKMAMKYLAEFSGGSGIECKILQANLILESFGNAKTSRNENSSRFGKLVEILFTVSGKICGAKIQTLLLEKSRVVLRPMNERSYHVFYYLCAGAPQFLRERLDLRGANEYAYLKQSDCLTIDNVDDAKRFHLLMEAFDTIQIPKENQEEVFMILAAVMWLGNVSFSVVDDKNHVEVVPNEGLRNAAKLLGCSIENLILALSNYRIGAVKEIATPKLTLAQAINARDALAKSLYVSLFDWLVEQVNKSLDAGQLHSGRSIGILDLYGFESFHKNGFEQFCINYADERLQQHFNRHLFKLEQEEYAREGIDWTRVDFIDNAECLNLFEKSPLGLLSLLDEESTSLKATDLTFANKLLEHLKDNSCFKSERDGDFSVRHCAGEVTYSTNGFLDKNRDPLQSDSMELLLSSNFSLPKLFATNLLTQSQNPWTSFGRPNGTDKPKQSVCIKLKTQLFRLMQCLENTAPHFIRCIKPNEKKFPGLFENDVVLGQLRCCGVLELVRISRAGYPTRMTHQDFATRYGFLLSKRVLSRDPLSISAAILQQFNVLPNMYQIGYSKLFFHTGQITSLEDVRNRTLRRILGVQKWFRQIQARHKFMELKNAATVLQSFVRGENERKKFKSNLRRWRAAITLQSVHRGNMARKRLCGLRNGRSSVIESTSSKHHSPGLEELQRRIFMVEKALQEKEDENLSLRRQLKQNEVRWSEYEEKMKSMEGMWQKQLISLQASLAEARSRLTTDDVAAHPGKVNASSPAPHLYDSEDTISVETRTPEATPPRISRPSTASCPLSRDSNGVVPHLLKEFEKKKQGFEDCALSLVDAKINTSNASEELRKLKLQFEAWKKEYRVKLHETKVALQNAANPENGKSSRRRWWEKLTGK